MTALRDPFDIVHKKDLKNKQGEVVARVDYVGWSQVADRLDEAAPGWSFEVIELRDDYCLGRLTLGDGRKFDNVGYAENADASWKKEVFKDAVSDALKRCAALAGVARYLYDKDAPHTTQGSATASRPVPASQPRTPAAPPSASGVLPEEPDYVREASAIFADVQPDRVRDEVATKDGQCPVHGLAWTLRPGGISKTTNKSYDAFWACPSTERPYCKEKPSARFVAAHEVAK